MFFVCPVIFKGKTNLYDLSEIYFSLFIFFSSVSGPLQVRCKSVVGPFLLRSLEWEVNGNCKGFATEVYGRWVLGVG